MRYNEKSILSTVLMLEMLSSSPATKQVSNISICLYVIHSNRKQKLVKYNTEYHPEGTSIRNVELKVQVQEANNVVGNFSKHDDEGSESSIDSENVISKYYRVKSYSITYRETAIITSNDNSQLFTLDLFLI